MVGGQGKTGFLYCIRVLLSHLQRTGAGDRETMISTGMSGGGQGPGASQGKVSDVQECAGCHKKIHDKFVLKVKLSHFSHASSWC